MREGWGRATKGGCFGDAVLEGVANLGKPRVQTTSEDTARKTGAADTFCAILGKETYLQGRTEDRADAIRSLVRYYTAHTGDGRGCGREGSKT